MKKGEQTRLHILNAGMKYSSQFGLADITIGTISSLCQMSRTGVISHFDNKEDMQLAILKYTQMRFEDFVLRPAKDPSALNYLKNILDLWRDWTINILQDEETSCPFIKAIVEFQNRPDSAVKSQVIEQQRDLLSLLEYRIEQCVKQGSFNSTVEKSAMAYEIYSLYLGHSIAKPSLELDKTNRYFSSAIQRLFDQAIEPAI